MSTVTEIAADVFRISTWAPEYGIQVNQFVVRDDEPFMMHTNFRKLFPETREALARIIDPARLRWIGYSHFESDECGALNEWLAAAPQAAAVASVVGQIVNLSDFAARPARGLADDEVLVTGRHHIRFLATPHLPHGWDAGLFFDETTRTLFCSDLFFQPGECEPLSKEDLVGRARDAIVQGKSGPLANDMPYTVKTDAMFQRLAALEPSTLATMHGSSYAGDGGRALRDLAAVVRELLA